MVKRTPPKFLFNYFPDLEAQARIDARRHLVLGHRRTRRRAVRHPHRSGHLSARRTSPNGELLSGLPLPDIRGTMGTFSYYATDLSRYEEGNTEMGGILKHLVFEGDTATTELEGPPSPIVRQQIEADPHARARA